jgi:hypothetical protein
VSKNDNEIVKEWVMMIKMAIDEKSPFRGMVDLTGIFGLPMDLQHAIHEQLSPEECDTMKELYA